ncbi:hypothetical protein [Chryseobacterium oryctis]|uniref:Lipoprotein n=1 Tax=Chryseobacterium oryctis TaxID=2952618 RepID=A0ABT3HSX0_9FLAO|nr:hypothetical protein [Chryseobacterium oryctis]MCW3162873.1 hypothetical protein [Chryseobacterium oryctis]
MKKIISFSLILLLFNCSKKEEQKKSKTTKDTIPKTTFVTFDFHDKELQENLNKAITKGDTIAYIRSYKKYSINGRDKEFLYYAILMAEKNNYKKAYYDISLILSLPPTDSLKGKFKSNSKFRDYSFYKSYEMGDEAAKEDIKYMFTEKNEIIPKSSSIYCK